MIHHPTTFLRHFSPPLRRFLVLVLITLSAALLSAPASAAQPTRTCAKPQAAHARHGQRCTPPAPQRAKPAKRVKQVAKPVKHVKAAQRVKPQQQAKVVKHAKPQQKTKAVKPAKPPRQAKAVKQAKPPRRATTTVHKKPRRRVQPKQSVVSHERTQRQRAARAASPKRKPHPPASPTPRVPPSSRASAGTLIGAKPQLLASCGFTPATKRQLRSRAIYVVDARTGTVLLERHAKQIRPIASISKLMTAVVSLDRRAPLAHRLRVTQADRDTLKFTGSRLKVGSVLSRRDMLHIALMSSENRAASALSRDYPGGRPAFIAAMNRKARQLGMPNTHFVNGTGLSPRNVSTARDLAQLVAAADRYPAIRTFSTDRAQIMRPGHGELSYVNSNALVRGGDMRIALQKTGFINEAGHCVVLRYLIGNRPVDVVLLDAPGPRDHIADAIRIRNWLDCSLR